MSDFLKLFNNIKVENDIPHYNYQYLKREEITNVNEDEPRSIGLKLNSETYKFENRKISTSFTRQMIYDLNQIHGFSLVDAGKNILVKEAEKNIELDIHKKILESCKIENISNYKGIRRLLYKYLKYDYPIILSKKKFNSEYIISNITLMANTLAINSRIGKGDFVIVSKEIYSLLNDSNKFQIINGDTNDTFSLMGEIFGIKIFIDNYSRYDSENFILVGRTSKPNQIGLQNISKEGIFQGIENPDFSTTVNYIIEFSYPLIGNVGDSYLYKSFKIQKGFKEWLLKYV